MTGFKHIFKTGWGKVDSPSGKIKVYKFFRDKKVISSTQRVVGRVLTLLALFALLPSSPRLGLLWGTHSIPSLRLALSSTVPASLAAAAVNYNSSRHLLSPFCIRLGSMPSTFLVSSYNLVTILQSDNIIMLILDMKSTKPERLHPFPEETQLVKCQKSDFCDFKAQALSSLHSALSCSLSLLLLAPASCYQPLYSANFLATDWSCPVPGCPEGSLATTRSWGPQPTSVIAKCSLPPPPGRPSHCLACLGQHIC